jgi:2-keto-3-deoxy-L-rhamnonate aldolase RhmA
VPPQARAVDGIDALWIGQSDLTASMGIPGRFDHPDFREATGRAREVCRRHGKVAVLGSGDVGVLPGGAAEGSTFSSTWRIRRSTSRHCGVS